MIDKLIVTHRAALRAKYGPQGLAAVMSAVDGLIAADQERGLITRLIALDGAAMKPHGRVTDAANPRQNKQAIDALHRAWRPHYLLILGSIDVVPHQDLVNPLHSDDQEGDPVAWSDLPYACDAAYSRDIARFIGPTRVVGRLADLTGAQEPSHLIACLETAATHRSRALKSYLDYFAISAQVWEQSSMLSVNNIFGHTRELLLSPPADRATVRRALRARCHFINCHGALADWRFYGDDGRSKPIALETGDIARSVREGTIAAAECCYGAELYDAVALSLPLPICQTYMAQKAYGFFGSTTLSYGPAVGNGGADLLTQYFLLEIQAGATTGLAAMKARQRYAQHASELDPIDLKTLAQFYLLGDPSVRPVLGDPVTRLAPSIEPAAGRRTVRAMRRAGGERIGHALAAVKPAAAQRIEPARSLRVRRALSQIAREVGAPPSAPFIAFAVRPSSTSGAASPRKTSDRYHLLVTTTPGSGTDDTRTRVAVVAREADQRIVAYRVYYQR